MSRSVGFSRCIIKCNFRSHNSSAKADATNPIHLIKRNPKDLGLQFTTRQGNPEKAIDAFAIEYNKNSVPFVWTKGPEKLTKIIELTKAFQEELSSN